MTQIQYTRLLKETICSPWKFCDAYQARSVFDKKNIVAFICSIDKRNKVNGNYEEKVNKPEARKCNIVAFILLEIM